MISQFRGAGDAMKIYIKTDEGIRFHIPLPMWMIKMGLSNTTIKIAAKNLKPDEKKHLEQINFRAIAKNIGELKKYKGLKIVDIKTNDGTEVKITV